MPMCSPEYLPLPTVFDFLHKEKGTFEFKDLLKVATETAEALQYLHENNIFYGCVETKNLLRNEEGVSVHRSLVSLNTQIHFHSFSC